VVELIILLVQHVFACYCPELTGIAHIRPALTEIKFITISKMTPAAQNRPIMPIPDPVSPTAAMGKVADINFLCSS